MYTTATSATVATGGGLSTYRPGATALHNETALWGRSYTPGYWGAPGAAPDPQLVAESQRYVASVGVDSTTGLVEISAYRRYGPRAG